MIKPIPMAVRSKASVCRRWITGLTGSNRGEGMEVRLLCSCVGSDLSDELITRSEESYRVCVCLCVCVSLTT